VAKIRTKKEEKIPQEVGKINTTRSGKKWKTKYLQKCSTKKSKEGLVT